MRLLLDTHVLLWAAGSPERLGAGALEAIEDPSNELHFSAASIWEVSIKSALGRDDFSVDAGALLRGLRYNGYVELPVTGSHAASVALLPRLHRDPFDRLLIAQAHTEALTLLTADRQVSQYPGPIRLLEQARPPEFE